MHAFAQALREEVARAGLSAYYLAEFTGLDPAFVRRLLAGEKNPSLQTVIALALALVSDPARYQADPTVAQVLSRLVAAAMADAVAGGRRRA